MKTNTRYLISILFLVISAVCSLTLVFKPLHTTSYEYKWNPSSSSDSGVFPLDRSWPEELETNFKFVCESTTLQRVVSLGGLEILCNQNSVFVITGKTKLTYNSLNTGDDISVLFDSKSSELQIRNLSSGVIKSKTIPYNDFPKITQLNSPNPSVVNLSVYIKTRPDSISPDYLRPLLLIVTIGFAIGAILIRQPIKQIRKIEQPTMFPFWKQGLFVSVSFFISALLIPMFYDDGWVIQRVSQYLKTGYLGDFFFHSNAWLPQGYLTESFLSLFIAAGLPYLVIRLFVVFLLIVTWVLCVQSISLLSPNRLSQVSVWIASATFVAISSVWCISMRAESWVCVFLAAQFYFLVRYTKNLSWLSFYLSGFFAALAVSTHQSGMLALIGSFGLVFLALKQHKWKIQATLLIAVVAIVATFVAMFFIGYDLSTLVSNVKDFSDGAYENRLNEFNRIGEIAGQAISSARKFGWILSILVFAFVLSNLSKIKKSFRFYAILLLSYPLGFLLTSSKWGWHLGVISVPIFLVFLFTLNYMKKQSPIKLKPSISLPILVLGAGISVASNGSWGTYDFRSLSWPDYSEFFAGPQSYIYWYVAAVLVYVLGRIIERRDNKIFNKLSTVLVVLVVLLPSTTAAIWIVSDSFLYKQPGLNSWTMLRQNLKVLTQKDSQSCGILGSVPAYSGQVQKLETLGSPEGAQLLDIVPSKLFGWKDITVWSSENSESQLESTDFYQVKYPITKGHHFAVWWNSNSDFVEDSAYISIGFRLTDGSETSKLYVMDIPDEGGTWNELKIDLPTKAVSLNVQTYGNQYSYLQVTEPLLVSDMNARSTLAQGTTFVAPSYLPAVPCAKLPYSAQGLFPVPNFIISQNYNLDTRMWVEQYFAPGSLMLTNIGQVEQGVPAIWKATFNTPSKVTLINQSTN